MIWLTWRQHRKQALFTLLGFAVLAALMIPIGLSMRHTFADLGLPDCVRGCAGTTWRRRPWRPATRRFNQFTNRYGSLNPGGRSASRSCRCSSACSGAPRWSPGRWSTAPTGSSGPRASSRRHWALVKFGLVGAVAVVAAVVLRAGHVLVGQPR